MTSIGVQFSASDDAEAEVALTALGRLLRERQFARFQTWLETRAMYPKRWRAAASESQSLFWVTVEELEALNEELVAHFMTRYRERLTDPATRPVGALPVELLLFTYPITPPDEER